MAYRETLGRVVFDFDAEGFEEFNILLTDLEIRIAGQSSDHRGLIACFLARAAYTNRSFEHQENVVTTILDPRYDIGNLLRIRQGLINCLAKFLHQVLQLLIHESPGPPESKLNL